jgi:hypothetical protein
LTTFSLLAADGASLSTADRSALVGDLNRALARAGGWHGGFTETSVRALCTAVAAGSDSTSIELAGQTRSRLGQLYNVLNSIGPVMHARHLAGLPARWAASVLAYWTANSPAGSSLVG